MINRCFNKWQNEQGLHLNLAEKKFNRPFFLVLVNSKLGVSQSSVTCICLYLNKNESWLILGSKISNYL